MSWSLEQMWAAMQARGAVRLLVKELAPNDNSRNQPYLAPGRSLAGFSIIPARNVSAVGRNFRADVNFAWIDEAGKLWPAPGAKVIQYGRHGEIRLSGFLRGCENAPRTLMNTREPGRVLFLGVTSSGVVAHVVGARSPLSAEARAMIAGGTTTRVSALHEFPTSLGLTNEQMLLRRLAEIHREGWVDGKRLRSDGQIVPYAARNSGGMTLEAELGVAANSIPLPDYLGWEVKGLSANNYLTPAAGSVITLITVQPRGGFYAEYGIADFVKRFGYPDKRGTPDRRNFGGRYLFGVPVPLTGAELKIDGYHPDSGIEAEGRLVLVMKDGTEGAIWPFADLLEHWTQKHARAVFVPYERSAPGTAAQFRYGSQVLLGWDSDLTRFIRQMWLRHAYYDPGCKLEGASTAAPRPKARHPFRITLSKLEGLYERIAWRDLAAH